MATIFKPPTQPVYDGRLSIFLAGTIDNGVADDWQAYVEKALSDFDVIVLNPRRDEWDSSWRQSIENKPFREQVEWELDGLEKAAVILMFFAPGSQSPITLLELGLMAHTNKLIISCPDGYWRKGNIEIVAHKYQIPLFNNLDEALSNIKKKMA